ncbi:hypothetical protein B0H14DRAFT_3044194 [Mycena olivaceomarginata]|nr:hypothetical protein B0H14DRAFT_3044194 [Mycena olivaceomarginata]
MSVERDTPLAKRDGYSGSSTHVWIGSQDWLANMILTVKTIAAGAEFIPVPYIRAAFGTVVILLETVDVRRRTFVLGPSAHDITEMKKNRDDFLDLCEIKVFTARISGESSLMTVAKYEDELDATPGLHALIYHDELIPLSIYRQFHRPSSDLVWVCIEGMLVRTLSDSSQHHCWSTDANIEKVYSRTVSNILTASPPDAALSRTLARNIDWKHLFATLIPVRFSGKIPWKMRTQLFLGSVIAHRCDGFIPVAYIPNSFTFLPGSFKAEEQPERDILLSCSITLEEDAVSALNMSWLSQGEFCRLGSTNPYSTGVVDKLWCALIGTLQEAHLFVRSVSVKHHGPRIGLDSAESDHFYWSLDPTGNTRMTPDECDSLGLPRLKARFWHEYHCDAIREFFEAKGFDPESRDVTRLLGLPLAETEPNIHHDDKVHP